MLNWYALYTKPRKEQKVAQQLEQLGFTVYLPLKTEVRQWSDRKKTIVTPLFTSYVFIQIEEAKRTEVFIIDGVLNYVFWLGKPAVIRNGEMQMMQNQIGKPNTALVVTTLQPGEQLYLKEGIFKGQEATVEYVSNQKTHLYLLSLGIKLIISSREV
ncbi:UpxY family transcription antiterminator [Flavobacterium tegetincola]|uniref:UpxY family transcription antiterminator n=1 Tax=Flavobacterium tegetincola TaxID=150172 RepID=UPI000423A0E8|nr:UpxY family transcription antiterminator [Flavobacterium tegetincola]